MGKRKSKTKVIKVKSNSLSSTFDCFSCHGEDCITVKIRDLIGTLRCRLCNFSAQYPCNALDRPIDVYSMWVDNIHQINAGDGEIMNDYENFQYATEDASKDTKKSKKVTAIKTKEQEDVGISVDGDFSDDEYDGDDLDRDDEELVVSDEDDEAPYKRSSSKSSSKRSAKYRDDDDESDFDSDDGSDDEGSSHKSKKDKKDKKHKKDKKDKKDKKQKKFRSNTDVSITKNEQELVQLAPVDKVEKVAPVVSKIEQNAYEDEQEPVEPIEPVVAVAVAPVKEEIIKREQE